MTELGRFSGEKTSYCYALKVAADDSAADFRLVQRSEHLLGQMFQLLWLFYFAAGVPGRLSKLNQADRMFSP
jgi:hypothetical protein